jgi:hypothetical protein
VARKFSREKAQKGAKILTKGNEGNDEKAKG